MELRTRVELITSLVVDFLSIQVILGCDFVVQKCRLNSTATAGYYNGRWDYHAYRLSTVIKKIGNDSAIYCATVITGQLETVEKGKDVKKYLAFTRVL